MSNKAKEIIIPQAKRVFRIIFLYVGQGDTTLLVVPDKDQYRYVLVDSNHSETDDGGIDIYKLFKDLFKDEQITLALYINTHPHKDHLDIVKKIYNDIGFDELWHSGHKSGGEHKEVYEELEYVIKKLGKDKVFQLLGTREDNKINDTVKKIGDINYNIIAPAEHVCDEIEDEKPEVRYQRIHEQCGVLRFRYGKKEKQVLIAGDADYKAWKNYITKYHKDRLPSTVLRSAHHGSKSFFWEGSPEEEDAYTEHLDTIDPDYIIISAPKSTESRHGHPDEEAVDLYEKKVGVENVYHLGKNRESIIVDITEQGDLEIKVDNELVKSYGTLSDEEAYSQRSSISYEKPRKESVLFPTRYG